MTPEQLRERSTEVLRPGWIRLSDTEAKELLRAHAAALEEIERVKAAHKADQRVAEHWLKCMREAESALAEAERRGREQGMREAAAICNEFKERWAKMEGDYSRSESGCYECGREDQCRALASAILAAIEAKP